MLPFVCNLVAILHDVTCKLFGSGDIGKKEKKELLSEQNVIQKIMVEGVDGRSVLIECLEYLQLPGQPDSLMKAAFRVFVACLKGATNVLLSEAHSALATPVGGRALQKLKDELDQSLLSVRDNLIKTDQMEAEKENEKTLKAIEEAKNNEMEHASHTHRYHDVIKHLMQDIKNGLAGDQVGQIGNEKAKGAEPESIMKKDTSVSKNTPSTFFSTNHAQKYGQSPSAPPH